MVHHARSARNEDIFARPGYSQLTPRSHEVRNHLTLPRNGLTCWPPSIPAGSKPCSIELDPTSVGVKSIRSNKIQQEPTYVGTVVMKNDADLQINVPQWRNPELRVQSLHGRVS